MRKWLFHGLIYSTLAGLLAAGIAYALGTNPAAVRPLVQQQITERFRQVSVSIERTRLRLLGGILVRELRLARSNGLDRRDFLYAPTAVIYHDKEHLLDGQMLIRKIELTKPQIRIVRERDGTFNLSGVLGPIDLTQPIPSIVIRQGSIVFEDRVSGSAPILEIRDVHASLINDPLPTIQIEGSGQVDVLGPIRFRGSIARANFALKFQIDLPSIQVDRALIARIGLLFPDLGKHALALSGKAELATTLEYDPGAKRPISYDVRGKLTEGRVVHKALPEPLERLDLSVHCTNGRVPLATMQAHCGPARLDVRVADADIPNAGQPLPDLDELGNEMDLTVKGLVVTPAVLERLPETVGFVREDYSPSGTVDLRYRFRKPGATSALIREWTLEPKGMSGAFKEFPCPVDDVRGSICIDSSRSPDRNLTFDLTGKVGDRPTSLRGTVKGPRRTAEVSVDIVGKGLLLDGKIDRALQKALKPKTYGVVRSFLPADCRQLGLDACPLCRADISIALRSPLGREKIDKRYLIRFENGRAQYDQFPYPMENVSGVLEVTSDGGWECRDFVGSHKGGRFRVEARSRRVEVPGRPGDERIEVSVRGQDLLLDEEFERALVPAGGDDRKGLQKAWRALRIGGRLSFEAELIDNPGQVQDLDVTVGVKGCTLRPTFFDYSMTDVSATVRYAKNRVDIKQMKARHGPATLGMKEGIIALGGGNSFTAWLVGITGAGVPIDRDLLHAFPEGMRKGVEKLAIQVPIDLACDLTVAAPTNAHDPVKLWWESAVAVKNATLRAGIEISKADGGFFCKGHHDGRQLRTVQGDLTLERATVLNQPLEKIHARLEVRSDSPDVFRFRDLKADLFGGTLGGEARIDTAPNLRYEVQLEAANVQLDRFGKHNLGGVSKSAQLSGPARAAIHLIGDGTDLLGLKGNGLISVPQGKMGQLPVLLDLIKAFGLRFPDRTAFEQANLVFGLEGPRVLVHQLDLYGNAISLRGQGTADLDGSNLNLEFTASPGRLSQLLPPALEGLPEAVGEQLYKIRMKGKLGKGLKFEQVPLPAVVEPLLKAVGGRQ